MDTVNVFPLQGKMEMGSSGPSGMFPRSRVFLQQLPMTTLRVYAHAADGTIACQYGMMAGEGRQS
ncbi:hypothetical protein HN371_24975 [Candidatus Poribacteria bacterium]|nr:hypothetical protein [Candidatus Poribacteria bacterium]MBT5537293.1 hypothetical protein [Candidatus Poribacteria bacterium]MBT5714893.1 hypothetical protein [Candidatus Poribacteria bacterium]MBT7098681.1 hypothetical protein [Candidatus Poribacteria bacterium]MBT7806244.1 hypothetical protein [Candidatus Poribacteria bacterium]